MSSQLTVDEEGIQIQQISINYRNTYTDIVGTHLHECACVLVRSCTTRTYEKPNIRYKYCILSSRKVIDVEHITTYNKVALRVYVINEYLLKKPQTYKRDLVYPVNIKVFKKSEKTFGNLVKDWFIAGKSKSNKTIRLLKSGNSHKRVDDDKEQHIYGVSVISSLCNYFSHFLCWPGCIQSSVCLSEVMHDDAAHCFVLSQMSIFTFRSLGHACACRAAIYSYNQSQSCHSQKRARFKQYHKSLQQKGNIQIMNR